MTTTLHQYRDAYATLTVATYEPLILRWVSATTLKTMANLMAWRAASDRRFPLAEDVPTETALAIARPRRTLGRPDRIEHGAGMVDIEAADFGGRSITGDMIQAARTDEFPDAALVGGSFFPKGILRRVRWTGETMLREAAERAETGVASRAMRAVAGVVAPKERSSELGVATLPFVVNAARTGVVRDDFDFYDTRRTLMNGAMAAVDAWLDDDDVDLAVRLHDVLKQNVYDLLPVVRIEEALSPIGVAHFYRQLYFNLEEGVGPIEQAFTVAPRETLEIVYETVRKQIHEERLEQGSEVVSESATEQKNLDEVSDKVSSMIQRDASAAMSVNASGSIGVWQAGAEASVSMDVSTQRSRENTSRRLKEITTRASERITKTFTLSVRDVEELTTTNLTRRVISNDGDDPVSYGLRRVLRKVRVKVQDLGPQLVWQLYVREPGAGLARSQFVHFREPSEIALPDVPPGVSKRPTGGTDTGTTSSALAWDTTRNTWYVTVKVQPGPGRVVTAVAIDSITDLEGGGKDDWAPAPRNANQWDTVWDAARSTYTTKIAIIEGDAASVTVTFTYTWEPDAAALAAWQAEVDAARAELEEERLVAKFEREKSTLTEVSKIRPRPATDLRREERYEVMNRMVSQLFARGEDPSVPTPLEIEYFHRYFDIDMMFTYTHPSWWRPRYSPVATGLGRPEYAITADSEPAPMGSSLGWLIQLDGDTRRNEFLNSPWVRACLPIRPNREREAVRWLAAHLEGKRGFDLDDGPLARALADVQEIRENERRLGIDGPEYVEVDSPVGAPGDALTPQDVYPIIDEFDVTLPTEGFVYDRLLVADDRDLPGGARPAPRRPR